jgi:hypothetical protein
MPTQAYRKLTVYPVLTSRRGRFEEESTLPRALIDSIGKNVTRASGLAGNGLLSPGLSFATNFSRISGQLALITRWPSRFYLTRAPDLLRQFLIKVQATFLVRFPELLVTPEREARSVHELH